MAAISLALGARARYTDFRYLWQHLSPEAMQEDFLGSLAALHIQPPGFNALLAGADLFGSSAELAWTFLGLAIGSATIALAADCARKLTSSYWAATSLGIFLALLPSSVLYSLWPSYTALVSLLVTTAAWSFISALNNQKTPSHSMWFWILSGLSATLLFLVRSSFAWPLIITWLLVLLWHARSLPQQRRFAVVGALALLGLGVFAVQIRATAVFGTWTLSSWSGQNLLNAAVASSAVSKSALTEAARSDPCLSYLANRYPFTPLTPGVVPSQGPEGCVVREYQTGKLQPSALSQERWENDQYNFNNAAELAWSPYWNQLAFRVISEDPTVIGRIIVGSENKVGSLQVLLSRSDTYNQVRDNWTLAGALLGKFWPLSVLWAPTVFGIVIIGSSVALVIPSLRKRIPRGYWTLVGATVALITVNIIGEYGENQRFRVELDPLLAILGVTITWTLLSAWRDRANHSTE